MVIQVCVGALVLKRAGTAQILLGKRTAARAFYPNVWDVPGGHCEAGESPEQTLVRELAEEIGVTPTAWHKLDELQLTTLGQADTLVMHFYAVTRWTGTPTNRQPEEHSEIGWFGIEEACTLDLADPEYPALFRRAIAIIS
ncbi:MAG: NUDIX hydrolase [Chloroflexota bacterium]|nr:NUDIX hydrolase [Chloroflexota bacterium]